MADLQRLGARLRDDVPHLVTQISTQLAADPELTAARGLTPTELEDHLTTFLSDLFLVVMASGEGDRARRLMVRDSTEIQLIIAELHGRQRRRLGWTARQLEREYEILHAEIQDLVRRRGADDQIGCATAARLLARLVAQARRQSRLGYRLATAEGARFVENRPDADLGR